MHKLELGEIKQYFDLNEDEGGDSFQSWWDADIATLAQLCSLNPHVTNNEVSEVNCLVDF